MQNKTVTSWQSTIIIIMFILGSSTIFGGSVESGQDVWISLLLGVLLSVPTVLICGRTLKLFPGMDLYDIIENVFGKIAGKIIIIFFSWYCLHLGSLVLINFTEYSTITTFVATPKIIIAITIFAASAYLAKSGVQTLAKWCVIIAAAIVTVFLFTLVISIKFMDTTNLFPIMNHSFKDIFKEAFEFLMFPLAETVLLTTIGCSINKGDNTYKIYMFAILAGSALIILLTLRNLLILGPDMIRTSMFSSYLTARVLSIGSSITRMEGVITFNYILGGITKAAICFLAASNGVSKLVNIKDYNKIIIPIGLFSLALSMIAYRNVAEQMTFFEFSPFYKIPFQLIIPFAVWLGCEIKAYLNKKKTINQNQT